MTASDWIAIYGAVVATAVAAHQFVQAWKSSRYLHVDETYWFGNPNGLDEEDLEDVHACGEDETADELTAQFSFYVSNRGAYPIIVRDACVYEKSYSWLGLRQVEEWAFVLSNDKRNPPGKFKLKPGEGRVLYARVDDMLDWRQKVNFKRRSLRFLTLKHSQSSKEFVHKFDLKQE